MLVKEFFAEPLYKPGSIFHRSNGDELILCADLRAGQAPLAFLIEGGHRVVGNSIRCSKDGSVSFEEVKQMLSDISSASIENPQMLKVGTKFKIDNRIWLLVRLSSHQAGLVCLIAPAVFWEATIDFRVNGFTRYALSMLGIRDEHEIIEVC